MNFSEAFNVYRELVLSSQTRREITSELGRWENHISPVLGGYELVQNQKSANFATEKNAGNQKIKPAEHLPLFVACPQSLAQGRGMGVVPRPRSTVQDAEIR